MYVTAHRVSRAASSTTGINAFLHLHGPEFPWPSDPWRLPDSDPGKLFRARISVEPGGNTMHAYLDVIAPDDARASELDVALTGLGQELVSTEAGPLPNPVVYRRGRVVIRFGVEDGTLPTRSVEFRELRRYVDPETAEWREASEAGAAG